MLTIYFVNGRILIMLYQSNYFYLNKEKKTPFRCNILSAWDVTCGEYHYTRDDYEKKYYPANTYCLIRGVEGKGVLNTIYGNFEISQNSLLLIKIEDTIDYKSITNFWHYKWVNFVINKDKLPILNTNQTYMINKTTLEDNLFDRLMIKGSNSNVDKNEINTIFTDIFYYFAKKENEVIKNEVKKPLIHYIKFFIEQNYMKKLTVEDLAKEFNFSSRRINQIFQERFNCSPKKYILNLKIEKSKELLINTSFSINEISFILGYSSPFHFSKSFNKSMGISPSKFRLNNSDGVNENN